MRRSWTLSLAALLTPALLAAQQPPPLTLSEAIRLAVAASPTLAATTAAARQAESNVRNAKAALYPELGAEGTAVRHEEPMIAFPLHELTVTTRPEFDQTLFQGNLLFGFTVFDGGIRRGQVSQARANETAATERQSGSAQGVVAGTTRAFVEVLTADAVLAAQEARVQALEAEVNRARRFLAEGRAARVEVLRAEAALAQAKADRVTIGARRDLAERNLASLLAVTPERTRASALVAVRPAAVAAESRDSLVLQAGEWNPELRAANAQVEAARSAARTASGALYPTLRVEGRLVTYGASQYSAQTEWQAGLRLTYPLFTGGTRGAAIDRTEAMLEEAQARVREVRLALERRVDQALAAATEATERAGALEVAVEQWTEVVRAESLALEQGAGTQNDFLRAQAELAATRAALAQARGLEVVARVDLAQVLGRLSPESLSTIVETRQ